jgi:hypothetical protein
MSLIIKNVDTADVILDDIGITLVPAEEYDLTQERALTVAGSSSLPAAITAGKIQILDPLDDVTPLSPTEAQEALAAMNDTHYRIRGGVLNQLNDVNLTSPATDDVMVYSGGEWANVPIATAASGISVTLEWKFDSSILATDPGNKKFRYNSLTPGSVTEIYFNDFTNSGVDASGLLAALAPGDKLYIQQKDIAAVAGLFTVVSVTDNVGWFTVAVTVDDIGLLPTNNKLCGAVIAYVGSRNEQDLWRTFTADTGSVSASSPTDTFAISGGAGISTAVSGSEVVITNTATSEDLASVVAGLTASIAIPTTWTDVNFDVTHVENNTAVVEHDNTNTDRFLIKETGLYFLNFAMSFDADAGEETIQGRFRINDTTVVPGSIRTASEDDEINDLSNAITAELTAGDFVSFQHQASGTGNVLDSSSNICITRASGVKGDKGDTGSGSTITIQDEGSTVTGGPHSTLNFVGDGITASNAGGGVATITVDAATKQAFHSHNNTTTQTLTTAFVTAIVGTDIRSDAIFSNTSGEVTVSKTGNFLISYDITGDSGGQRSSMECVLQVNGTDVPGSFAYGYHRSSSNGEDTASATVLRALTSGDVVRVRIREINGSITTVANACRLVIKEID